MTRVAFFLDTQRIRSTDLRDVHAGNPGIGGTEYMFFLVAAHLARTHQVTMNVTAACRHPPAVRQVVVPDFRTESVAMRSADEGSGSCVSPRSCPIRPVLCVSRRQYELLRDEEVVRKSDYIFNAVATSACPTEPHRPTRDDVFYMGSLVKG